MVKKYSFFVPDIEYLVDLEGLLEYLQEKVRLGNMCLYCEKRFSSTIACQHHMISSSHCKMKYEGKINFYFVYYFSFSLLTVSYNLLHYLILTFYIYYYFRG